MPARATKRRRLSPPEEPIKTKVPKPTETEKDFEPGVFSKASRNSGWNDEQDYEQRPRRVKSQADGARLPIKTAEGLVVAQPVQAAPVVEESEDSFLASDDEDGEDVGQNGIAGEEEAKPEEPKISLRQRITEAKEELARLAGHINEDPETNIGALKSLEALAESPYIPIKKIALATQLAVYKDIIPGYRIRPIAGDEVSSTKISKDVRKLRAFEQSLLSGYQKYLKNLGQHAKASGSKEKEEASLASVAISCACNLVTSVSHFNFRDQLLQIIIRKLGTSKVDNDFLKCIECVETLFRIDEDGNASRDAVQQLNSLAKTKNYHFDESILNTFLHLRLLSELGIKGSHEKIDDPEDQQKKGKTKWKKEWRSKKEKKMARENKAIEKEFKEADAAVSHEERDKNQAETLKIVFVTYFQILKKRNSKLMGAVLEGLAKYSHLINQDFFGDILEVLKELITQVEAQNEVEQDPDDESSTSSTDHHQQRTRSALLCCVTAFALLQGQDAAYATSTLHLDLSFFVNHLYRTLLPVSLNPDIELNNKSLRLPDPHAPSSQPETPRTKVNVQTTTVLLIRSLTSVLLPAQALRSIPPIRIAAFAKQILLSAIHLPEKSATAMLGLMNIIVKQHGKKICGMWNTEERRGDGVWNGTGEGSGEKPEGSNPFASTVWEGEILRVHFSPAVREAWDGVVKGVREAGK